MCVWGPGGQGGGDSLMGGERGSSMHASSTLVLEKILPFFYHQENHDLKA